MRRRDERERERDVWGFACDITELDEQNLIIILGVIRDLVEIFRL